MRLIDADILKSAIVVDGYEHFSGCLSSSEVALLEMVKDDIDEIPTVDAVPVVRCEKCVAHGNCFAERVFVYTGIENPYCCAGERKDGDRNG